ncbi:MAG: hypothetical protein HZB86_07535 [Deltaproteobacteria bacterium]|nr:hypothetical protein [Deltaproteobacteria bacterium]
MPMPFTKYTFKMPILRTAYILFVASLFDMPTYVSCSPRRFAFKVSFDG